MGNKPLKISYLLPFWMQLFCLNIHQLRGCLCMCVCVGPYRPNYVIISALLSPHIDPEYYSLFSPLGKLADRAIYFTFRNLFFLFFLTWAKLSQDLPDWFSRLFNQMNGRLFAWTLLIRTSFSDFSRHVAMATNLRQNWRNDLNSTRWRFETDSSITIRHKMFYML